MIKFVENEDEKELIAEKILLDLPDWFGIPENTRHYIEGSRKLPFWASFDEQGNDNGFIVLKQTGPVTAEIYVMGVLQNTHRKGIGVQLWEAFKAYAKKQGYEYVQVKTVQMGKYEDYDRTNCFYQKIGFKELEVFQTLWDEWNPCQIYVQYIK